MSVLCRRLSLHTEGGLAKPGINKKMIETSEHLKHINCYPWGDKVSVLTHTYEHKPLRKIPWPPVITKLIAHFGLVSDMVICKYRKEYMVINDTECLYLDQVSLTTQTPLIPCSWSLFSYQLHFPTPRTQLEWKLTA